MRKLLFMLGFILISLLANAAKPVIVEIDSISYSLDVVNVTATVMTSDKNISHADILEHVMYDGVEYSVVKIAERAFQKCYNLISINIPNTVIEIGERGFEHCEKLKQVKLPFNLERIEDGLFYYCNKLESVEMPKNVVWIGASAFIKCESLQSIVLPKTLNRILYYAFSECKSLKQVYIEDIASWCNVVLDGPDTSPFINNADLYVSNTLVENLQIPEGVTRILKNNFMGCNSIKHVSFPKSAEVINGFNSCPNLMSISIHSEALLSDKSFGNLPNLNTVNCYTPIPPEIETYAYIGLLEGSAFTDSYPEYMTLHVPVGSKELYENSYGWKDFGTIIDDLSDNPITGVDNLQFNESSSIEIFNLNGRLVFSGIGEYQLPSGVYIIRQGSVRKKILIE